MDKASWSTIAPAIWNLVWIAVCGAAGAVARYAVSGWMHKLLGAAFPYGTLTVNVAGCFLLGLLMRVSVNTDAIPLSVRTPLSIGFLGALTTFSTFGYETFDYLEGGQWHSALGNIAANMLLGLLGVWGGIAAARAVVGGA